MAKDVQTEQPTAPTLTGEQMLDVIRMLVESNQSNTKDLASLVGQAVADASQKTRQWWNEADFPDKSHLNPLGEKDNPRPTFVRNIFLLGYLCKEDQHTREEIELLNKLKPGKFHMHTPQGQVERHNFFEVRELSPGVPNGDLLVTFPCAETTDRMALMRYDRGRGMVDLLLELLPNEQAAA